MSRRLGDDPLTRARTERAKAAAGSTPITVGAGGQEATARVGAQSESRASYNDVFFQRRGGDTAAQQPAGSASIAETPEISEISQFPEIRDAAAASGSDANFGSSVESNPASLETKIPQDVPRPPVSIIEEVSVNPDDGDFSTASPAVTLPQTNEELSPPITFQGPAKGNDGSHSEPPKSGGFFKRLFGKFK